MGLSMNIRRRPERGSVWRIAPPLTVSTHEVDRAVAILDQALRESLDEMARPRGLRQQPQQKSRVKRVAHTHSRRPQSTPTPSWPAQAGHPRFAWVLKIG